MAAVFVTPILMVGRQAYEGEWASHAGPVPAMVASLVLTLVVPVLAGMVIRRVRPTRALRHQRGFFGLSIAALIGFAIVQEAEHFARVLAVRNRLPSSIALHLFVAAIVSMALMGRQQGISGERRLGSAIGFAVLVCMVVWVTLDLNQPRRGWITVSQEPLQQLLKSMEK